MMTDTTIYGYVGDGFVVCHACYDPAEYGFPGGDEPLSPLYSLDDDGSGWTCDQCHGWVFEPYLTADEIRSGWDLAGPADFTLDDAPDEVEMISPIGDVYMAEVRPLETHYGWALGAHVGDLPVVLWTSPDTGGVEGMVA